MRAVGHEVHEAVGRFRELEVRLVCLLHVRFSLPMLAHDVDPMNVIGCQPPHCILVGCVPRGLPTAQRCLDNTLSLICSIGNLRMALVTGASISMTKPFSQ